jgi:hypothetical protein
MNTKILALLGTLALAVIAVVVVREMGRGPGPAAQASPAAVPGLIDRVNDVAEVGVEHGAARFTIRRVGDRWSLVEKGGYPVSFEKVKSAVMGLAQLKVLEEKTSRPERYATIGVQDPAAGTGNAEEEVWGGPTRLTLKDGAGAVLASVIVGNARGSSVYIRRTGEAQSYLAEGQVEAPGQPSGWMDTKLVELPASRVASVSVHHPDGEVVHATKGTPDQLNFAVLDVPQGRELRSPGAADPLGAGLAYVNFEDVAPAGSIDLSGKDESVKPGPVAEFRTFEGQVLTLQLAEKDGKTWVQVAAGLDPAAAAEPAKPGQKSPEEAAREVEELSARLSPWVFRVPDYKATVLRTRMTDLLKELPGDGGQHPPPTLAPEHGAAPVPLVIPPPQAPAAAPPSGQPPDAEPGPAAPPPGDAGSGGESAGEPGGSR